MSNKVFEDLQKLHSKKTHDRFDEIINENWFNR